MSPRPPPLPLRCGDIDPASIDLDPGYSWHPKEITVPGRPGWVSIARRTVLSRLSSPYRISCRCAAPPLISVLSSPDDGATLPSTLCRNGTQRAVLRPVGTSPYSREIIGGGGIRHPPAANGTSALCPVAFPTRGAPRH